MTQNRKRIVPWACIAPLAVAVGLTACGGGGGGSSSSTSNEISETSARAFQVPSEISAVPTSSSSSNAPGLAASVRTLSNLRALQSLNTHDDSATVSLDDSSDYMNAVPRKYVETKVLDEAFSIIGQVMGAVKQTQYWDDAVLNQGPYVAMIGWEEDQMGQDIKTVEKWTVDASYNGNAADNPYANNGIFTIQAWVPGEVEGEYIRALFTIYKGATTNVDTGEVSDFGIWDINVKFDETGTEFFRATARVESGRSVVRIDTYETHAEGPDSVEFVWNMKAYLSRSADGADGYGKVYIPMFDDQTCGQGPVAPGTNCTVNRFIPYAFNGTYLELGIDADGNNSLADIDDEEYILKRTTQAEVTHRYGVFYAQASSNGAINAGDNVTRHNEFGFPVFADIQENGATRRQYGFYGAWRGEHNLWGFQTCGEVNGNFSCSNSVSNGATVTREAWTANGRVETAYTVQAVPSVIGKRDYQTASVTDVKDTPIRVFLNKHFNLAYDAGKAGSLGLCKGQIWRDFGNGGAVNCEYMDWTTNPPTPTPLPLADFDGIDVLKESDWNHGWVEHLNGNNSTIMYLTALPQGWNGAVNSAGFHVVDFQAQSVTGAFTPAAGDIVRLDANADIWLALKDGGASATDGLDLAWYVKQVTGGYDWEPTFGDAANDTVFVFPDGEQVRADIGGNQYIVRKNPGADGTAAAHYTTIVENQTTLTPSKTGFFPSGLSYLVRFDDFDRKVRLAYDSALQALEIVAGESDVRTECAGSDTDADNKKLYTCDEWMLVGFNDAGTANDVSDDYAIDDAATRAMDDTGNICAFPGQLNCSSKIAVQFMYRYNANGAQTYLVASGASTPTLLSDPVTLTAVPLADAYGAATNETRTLRFDGFMHGLSNFRDQFQEGGFDDFLSKVRNVLYVDGKVTKVSGTVDGVAAPLLIKPLETSVFLEDVTADDAQNPIPDGELPAIDTAIAVSLDNEISDATMPDLADNTMGALPTGDTVEVKFVEGVSVE